MSVKLAMNDGEWIKQTLDKEDKPPVKIGSLNWFTIGKTIQFPNLSLRYHMLSDLHTSIIPQIYKLMR